MLKRRSLKKQTQDVKKPEGDRLGEWLIWWKASMCWIQQEQQPPPSFPETKAQRGVEGSPVTGWLGESRTRPDGQLQQFQRPHVTVPFLDVCPNLAFHRLSPGYWVYTEPKTEEASHELPTHTDKCQTYTHTHTLSQHTLVGFYLDSMVGGLMAGASRPWRSVVLLGKATLYVNPPLLIPGFSNTLLYLDSLRPPLQNSGVCAWSSHLKIGKSHSTFNVRSSTCYGVLLCIGMCKGVLNSKQNKS